MSKRTLMCGCLEMGFKRHCEGRPCPGHTRCERCAKVIPMDDKRSRFALNAELIRDRNLHQLHARYRRGGWVCRTPCKIEEGCTLA